MRVHMDVLDTDFNVIAQFHDIGDSSSGFTHIHEDGTNHFHSPTDISGTEDILVDGNVDVDVTRLTRRTFTANVLNPNGVWSPGSDWGGMFYVNRLIRLWRGIAYGESPGSGKELVPIGTFMIDAADVEVERSMSIVTLSGSDLWKKFGKSAFRWAKSWAANTPINTVISDIATQAGITDINLDPLSSRAAADTQIPKKFMVEQGDNRGEALARVCNENGIDIYFDPMGRLTTQDFKAPGDTSVVYTYGPEANNNLLTVKASFTDENLYNSVLVIGTGAKSAIVSSRVRDTDPTSVTNVDRLGERTFIHETDLIQTQTIADIVAKRLFYQKVLVNEDITLETICNPAFEGNDVIRVKETEFSKLDGTFRIKAFTVPMSTSRQTIRLLREIKLT